MPVYPGYVVATAASLLLGHPVKWIEDRSENLISTGFARDYHMHGELALKSDGTMLGLRASLLADEGAFYADAQPSKFKVGPVPHRERLLRPAGDPRHGRGRVHEQGARRRRLPMLVPRDRGLVPDRAPGVERRVRAGDGSGRAPEEELHPEGPVPVHVVDRVRLRLRRLPGRHGQGARDDRLRRPAQGAGGGARPGQAVRHRRRVVHRGRRAPARRRTTTSSA